MIHHHFRWLGIIDSKGLFIKIKVTKMILVLLPFFFFFVQLPYSCRSFSTNKWVKLSWCNSVYILSRTLFSLMKRHYLILNFLYAILFLFCGHPPPFHRFVSTIIIIIIILLESLELVVLAKKWLDFQGFFNKKYSSNMLSFWLIFSKY